MSDLNLSSVSYDKSIHVAILVHSLMGALTELAIIAHDGSGYELSQSDIDDLDLSYARLGALLRTLTAPPKDQIQ